MDKKDAVVAVAEEAVKTGLITPKRLVVVAAVVAVVTVGVFVTRKLRSDDEVEEIERIAEPKKTNHEKK